MTARRPPSPPPPAAPSRHTGRQRSANASGSDSLSEGRRVPAAATAGRAATNGAETGSLPCVVAYAPRERMRAMLRTAFPRRRARLAVVRRAPELARAFRTMLVDAVLVDLSGATDDAWAAAAYAREFPSTPFFAVTALRSADGPTLARCAALDFADVLVEGVDDEALRALVLPLSFHARFVAALREPPPALGLATPLQRKTWTCVVAHAGLPVRTDAVARVVGVTREHLSRAFAAARAPNLKRVIDLVRLVAAAELAKNPGYDLRDVAGVLGFASPSHLSSTTQRVLGLRPASLARLRAIDLIERFAGGRGRSRSAVRQ